MVWSPPRVTSCAPLVDQRRRLLLDLADRGGDVEWGAGDVAGVDDLLAGERQDLHLGVVRPQHAGALADVGGPETRTGPIADARVERDADDGHVAAGDVARSRGSRANVEKPAYRGTTVDRRPAAPARCCSLMSGTSLCLR